MPAKVYFSRDISPEKVVAMYKALGMADAASSVVKHFEGKIAFINVMKNLSVDCDCCVVAEDPCMKDIPLLDVKTIIPFCSHGGGRFGQSLTAIAKLTPDANMGIGLAINYSGGSSMPGNVTAWLGANGIEN